MSHWQAAALGLGILAMAPSARAQAPTAGDNVNMVSGTEWPGGDPFLQRDNEPSIAVSSLNLNRLLAGGNTYRTVDIPFPPGGDTETGDAWLGIYKSFDAGRTWKTYLLPGYPQDPSAEGAASPLKQRGLTAAADPTVRAGTNGFFLMSGIAFNRETDDGVVFVSRHIDLDMKENGDAALGRDTIPYLDTVLVDTGNSGQFLDKPWIAIDIPRSFASGTCMVTANVTTESSTGQLVTTPVTRSFPVGPMYMAWSRFTGNQDPALGNNRSTKLVIARSLDCGKTWSNPTKISEGSSVNQGAAIAIDPLTGAVYVAWRRFATSSQTDAILVARSDDGHVFPSKDTHEVASFAPFDQGTSAYSFRTNALPTIAVSVAGSSSYVHVGWAQRSPAEPACPVGFARVVVSTSADGGATWTAPAKVDDGPAKDEWGQPYQTDDSQTLVCGHQIMPQMTFSGGKLVVLYYDMRLDHTTGVFAPNDPFKADGEGRFYDETREKRGELAEPGAQPEAVYQPFITDADLTLRRHTIDVRVAQADPGPTLQWHSAPVSRYRFGTRGDETVSEGDPLKQLQVNPPNLPLFQRGTVPFIGDYIDIIGQGFLPPTGPGGLWRYNLAEAAPVFYATWTSNQDVRPPADGDWTNYRPPPFPRCPVDEPDCVRTSVFDPSQSTSPCVPGQEGMRNQNIYMSRITQGLIVSSPQSSKRLSPTHERAFVVIVENTTSLERIYRLSIASQPASGRASFLAFTSAEDPLQCATHEPAVNSGEPPVCTGLEATIPARSSIARSVFVKSNASDPPIDPNAKITVNVHEIGGDSLSGYVTLNAVPVGDLAAPDGGTDSDDGETYDPSIAFINVSNPNVSNINVSNVNVSNINVSNPNVSNINVSNPDIADINVSNINVSNINVSNINVSNINVSNINVSNDPVSDANYTITNTGNTTHSYHVTLVGEAPPTGTLQLIVSKPYATPVARPDATSCELGLESRPATLASVSPRIVPPGEQAGDPNIPDFRATNATLSLAPGETAIVTVRGNVGLSPMQQVASQLTAAVVAHGAAGGTGFAAALTFSAAALPVPQVGAYYEGHLQPLGGTGPYTWEVTEGALPDGLALLPDGTLAGTVQGTPTTPGEATFEVTVTDAKGATASQALSLSVTQGPTTLTLVAEPSASVFGQPVTFTATVSPASPGGEVPVPGGSVSFSVDGEEPGVSVPLVSGSAAFATAALGVGGHSIRAVYGGDANYASGSEQTVSHEVGTASTTTTIDSDLPDPSLIGTGVTVAVSVIANLPATGTPTGSVGVSGGGGSCSIVLSAGAGSCTLVPTSVGAATLTAGYTGSPDGGFGSSSDTESHQVTGNTTTTITSDAPDPSVVGQPVAVSVTVAAVAPATGTPTGTVDVSGGDGGGSCTITLAGGTGSCTLTPTSIGATTLTAGYAGDSTFNPSSGTALHTVNKPPYTFTGFLNPLAAATRYSAPASNSGSWTFSRVLPIKWQLKDASGKAVTSASAIRSLMAAKNGTCPYPPASQTLPPPADATVAALYDPVNGAAGGSDFRPGNTYNFNWDATKNAGPGCWWLVLQLDDGSTWTTTVQLK